MTHITLPTHPTPEGPTLYSGSYSNSAGRTPVSTTITSMPANTKTPAGAAHINKNNGNSVFQLVPVWAIQLGRHGLGGDISMSNGGSAAVNCLASAWVFGGKSTLMYCAGLTAYTCCTLTQFIFHYDYISITSTRTHRPWVCNHSRSLVAQTI